MKSYPNGMTVAELKAYVADLPETDSNGEPFEVWIESGPGLSSPVHAIWPLNKKNEGSDLLFSCEN